MPDELHSTKKKYKVIGTRPIRHDGVDKVTGKALYGADIQLPSMLHGKYSVALMLMQESNQ